MAELCANVNHFTLPSKFFDKAFAVKYQVLPMPFVGVL